MNFSERPRREKHSPLGDVNEDGGSEQPSNKEEEFNSCGSLHTSLNICSTVLSIYLCPTPIKTYMSSDIN